MNDITTQDAITAAMAAVDKLSLKEKAAIHAMLTLQLKGAGNTAVDFLPNIPTLDAKKFKFGDIVSFVKSGSGRHAGKHYLIVEKFNRAGNAAVGYECDANGVKNPLPVRWTVALSHLSLVK